MGNRQPSTILDEDINEFRRELNCNYSRWESLEYFKKRYDRFCSTARGLEGEKGQLCKSLLEDAAKKLAEESIKLVGTYQIGFQQYKVNEREIPILYDLFEGLTDMLESDLPQEVKESVAKASEDIASLGELA